jgi:hypothetical protein
MRRRVDGDSRDRVSHHHFVVDPVADTHRAANAVLL